jgi:hypothetical protein
MLKRAREVISSGSVHAIVDFGVELDRKIKLEVSELEEIKKFLRSLGETSLEDRRSEKSVQIEGNLGVAIVTYPKSTPKLKPGVDLLASEEGIPPDVFRVLFRKKTVVDLAEGFLEKLGDIPVEDREMILDLIEVHSSTPRVTWK